MVYLNKIKNANINLGLNNNINALEFYILAKNVFDFDDLIQLNETNLKARKVNENDFVFVQNLYKVVQENKVKENIQIIDISNKTL
ncbi:MAG: hypothetical protein LBU14_01800 [Candidatus Peribacteria bacterium]|nr:hypothetical protein [Candidatus Peribacteria bacterium]